MGTTTITVSSAATDSYTAATNSGALTFDINVTASTPTVGNITAPTAVTEGYALTLTAPSVSANGDTVTAQGWQISANGTGGWTDFDTATAMTTPHNGQYLRYYATNSVGTGYSNAVQITVNAAPVVPMVNSVTVTPGTASVAKGGTRQFSSNVDVTGGALQAVTWSVDGTDSSIDTSGKLEVGASETATTLTVTATSDFDKTKKGTASVTVTTQTVDPPADPEPITVISRPNANSPLNLTKDAAFSFSGEYASLAAVRLNGHTLAQTAVSGTQANLSGYPGYAPVLGNASEGSTVVTLYKEFLQFLPDGAYTLEVEFADGSVTNMGSLGFEIKRNSTPTTTPTTAPAATTTTTYGSTSPKTGDDTNISLFIVLVLAAGVVIIGVVVYRKRKACR